jgi:hypothetical protein
MEPAEYCRAIETYLCQKNGGHLIRIVGPVFEQVCGWAAQGIPLTLVYRGIDRYCERRRRKASNRRPARIEFCEPDILDLFDDWRRAVGLNRAQAGGAVGVGGGAPGDGEEDSSPSRRGSLPAHLDRVILRLTSLQALAAGELAGLLERALQEVDACRPAARSRGEARARLIDRLGVLDRELVDAVRHATPPATIEALGREAEQELAPFLPRMPEDARRRALDACVDRLLREQLGLPRIAFE